MYLRSLRGAVCCLVVLLGLWSCGGEGDKKAQMPMPLVALYDVVAKDYPWPSQYQAEASGSRAVEVRSRVQAIIEERLYSEGDFVKEGQLLFQLERDQYEARMEQAEAQYDSAAREWKRIRPLYEKNAVSQKDRDNARAAYESAKAELRQARINLDYCQVTAPVSGFSSKESVTPGNLVGNNSLLTYVNQTDPMNIDFSIPATEYMRRRQLEAEGRLVAPPDNRYKARLRLLDGTMYDVEGEVTFIDRQVQSATGVIKARAVFDNPDARIMPGQYVRIFMDGDVLKNAVLIPQKCVMLTQHGATVMKVDAEGTVTAVPVSLSESIGNMYLVESGLSGGERIISEGMVKARPGSKVRTEQPAKQPAQPGAAGK